jgi:glucokinase
VTELVAVDIGGTNARFAIAEVAGGRVVSLSPETTFHTSRYASFQLAWEAFAECLGRPLPRATSIAFAGPIGGEVLKMTNNPWVIRPSLIPSKLNVDRFSLINDFGAIGYAVGQAGPEHFRHVCGPDRPLPNDGTLTVVGPGTGLGVAHILRRAGHHFVSETEGGHIDYAPLDSIEDTILAHLRHQYRRVSVERIVSGPGLANIYAALATMDGHAIPPREDKQLWIDAMSGQDSLAAAALDRFCLSFGAVAGDLALAHGASGVVIAGGVGLRLADHLPRSGFGQRFVAKGRFESMMAGVPVKLITHPQPGLLGAAAAFAEEHGR